MLLSNSGFGQIIEFTSDHGPLAYVWKISTSEGAPSGAGAITRAAAPSPKIIREVRTVPILSENFSAHTSRTGRSISCSWRTASAIPYGKPAQAATISLELWVCSNPSSPESHVATEGISLVLVQVQNSTAPISAGFRPDFANARFAAIRAIS